MKTSIIKTLFLCCFIALVTSSCQKEVIYPTDELPSNIPRLDTVNVIGGWGEFLLIDAQMFVENKETGVRTVYNHFDVNKSRSSLRWDGSLYDIEDIIKDTTTYSFWKPLTFPGVGKFVLNDDTTKFYGVQYTGQYRTIIEDPTHQQQNIGGSSRPFSGYTIDYNHQIVVINIQEMEGSINGYNCRYWNKLTFKKIKSW